MSSRVFPVKMGSLAMFGGRRHLTRYTLASTSRPKPRMRQKIDIKAVLEPKDQDDKPEHAKRVPGNNKATLEQKENYRTPFVSFGYMDALNVALSGENQLLFTEYSDYASIKDEHVRDVRHLRKNLVDLLLEYPKRTAGDLVVMKQLPVKRVVLPDDLADALTAELQSVESVEEISELIESYRETKLQRYKVSDVVAALVSVLDSPSVLAKLVSWKIVDFEFPELAEIVTSFISRDLGSVQTIISSFEKINGKGSFLATATATLKLDLLVAFVEARDFQSAFQCLNSLMASKVCPSPELTTDYIQLVSDTANAINSEFNDKKMVFNAYSTPVAKIMRTPEAMSSKMVSIIVPWLSDNELKWFVNYLRLCPDHNIPYLELIQRFASTLQGMPVDNAIQLTAFIKSLGSDKFDRDTKVAIATLYAKYKSPLAVRIWIDSLQLTATESTELVKLLESASRSSVFATQQLPGRSKEDIVSLMNELK